MTPAAKTLSVIIATRNRPAPLRDTLASISRLSRIPDELLVIDASDDDGTKTVVASASERLRPVICYHRWTDPPSSARQRNRGIALAQSEIVSFLDDDVELQPDFFSHLVRPLEQDTSDSIGGVVATIVNEFLPPYSRFNGMLLRLILGTPVDDVAGRVVGPAVQFLYSDPGDSNQPVDYLTTCASAYPARRLVHNRFAETFEGYSFMEDVELSMRIGLRHTLLQVGKARMTHLGLGSHTKRNFISDGRARLLNRHFVMTGVYNKRDAISLLRLLLFEVAYSTLAGLWNGGRGGKIEITLRQLIGRMLAAIEVLTGQSPHMRGLNTR